MYKFDTNVLSRSSSLIDLDVSNFEYRTRAIISLYFFYPFFTVAVAYTADNLCTKQGNVGLKPVAYKRERLMMACVRYLF